MTTRPQTCMTDGCRRPRMLAEAHCRECLMAIEGPPPEYRPGFIPPESERGQ